MIKLRPKTFEMLRLLVTNAGRVMSKNELMEAVWPNVHVGEDSLFQCIREIRTALGDDRRQVVRLASGHGYLFTAEVSAVQAAAVGPITPSSVEPARPEPRSGLPTSRWSVVDWRKPVALVSVVAAGAVVAVLMVASAWRPDPVSNGAGPALAIMPVVGTGTDPEVAAMAQGVTERLTDGFAGIENIRVIASPTAALETASASSAQPALVIRGELQRGARSWTLQTRMIDTATGEIQTVATVSVSADEPDRQRQQSQLAAGAGYQLARRLNGMLVASKTSAATGGPLDDAKVVIEQANASINQTTPERFSMAQTILQKALAADPDNVDLAIALAGLQMRGIQMVWYRPAEARAAEAHAGAVLEHALQLRPNSIPVLESYCRFLSATNHFAESLVTCARTLKFDPWNGLALFLVGLGQLHLGRFDDALATFLQADRYDTPPVSRWTWLVGVGWAHVMMGHNEEALPWLNRSIAITAASGRSYMLLAAANQQLGRIDEARAAMKKGLKLRPGTTSLNVMPPIKNASPIFIDTSKRIVRFMVAAGLPER
ncbi:MAG: winged helix-turn-helix domain-containing protein [Pseudolabrys sp.]